MNTHNVEIQSNWVNALWNQGKTASKSSAALQCPYCPPGTFFQGTEQLWAHTKFEHAKQIVNKDANQVRDLALKLRKSDQSLDATAGGITPDITGLSINSGEERKCSPPPSKKRRADSELNAQRRAPIKMEIPIKVEVADSGFPTDIPHAIAPEQIRSKPQEARVFDYKKGAKHVGSPKQPPKVNKVTEKQYRKIVERPSSTDPQPENPPRQIGLPELARYDPRYPDLLLQPDSRPISQEQLASEVKSIYAGLIMVERKCKDVDHNLLQARLSNPDQRLTSEQWQAIIALHRTLLHEHHDFFLASQHPSASPALRRLAAKYNMPGRMWRIGIHPFLEELRLRTADELRSRRTQGQEDKSEIRDHMMAFIYLTYQMVALLYETVPAFEYTWIECLGDLGRYRMTVENDARDYESWTNVSRSWYSKAADKTPEVGRLAHHLAILARSNALQQSYYYSKSLTSLEPFENARQSITGHFATARGTLDVTPTYSHALPVEESFIRAHACLFERNEKNDFEAARLEFTEQLDNHIGRVTAMWKDQGAHIAITNIAAWFGYGIELNVLRQVFLTRLYRPDPQNRTNTELFFTSTAEQWKPSSSMLDNFLNEEDISSGLAALASDSTFAKAGRLTHDTFALALRRIGDKNVLPHVHIMLSFFSSLASLDNVAHLIDHAPWVELVAFLNTLIKTEIQQNRMQNINAVLAEPIFPIDSNKNRGDELPLPEDYMIRGLIWAPVYFPANWFGRELDEEERCLELASTTRSRMERILRLGIQISSLNRWLSYDRDTHTFAIIGR